MAVYQFSALSDGQAISFNPSADVLQFDQPAIAAAEIRALIEGSNLRLRYVEDGKDVVLLSTAPAQITVSNVTFADGSRLVFGNDSSNSLLGTAGADHLWGLGGNDTLNGGAGNDWLSGGAGQDNLTGGTGADAYVFVDTPFNNNYDRVHGFVSGSDSLWLHEGAYGAAGALGRFSAGDGRFYAAAGATSGHDTDDRIIYNTTNGYFYYDADGSGAGKAMFVGILQGAPTLAASDFVLFGDDGAGPPPPSGGTEGDDTLIGTSGDDYLSALGGNDLLIGGAGADTLDGGTGNDTFVVDASDVLIDAAGIDTVQSEVTWTLGDGFENLTLIGSAAVNAIGNALANRMVGNDAANGFSGRAGDDTLIGNGGDDVFVMSTGGMPSYGRDSIDGGAGVDTLDFGANGVSAIVVDLSAGTLSGGDEAGTGSAVLSGIENVNGGVAADRIAGDGAANFFFGFHGDDTLIGAGGNDRLEGGDGRDSLSGGAGNDTLIGGANTSAQAQVLDGGPGADSMAGGAGGDVFFVDDPGDTLSDSGGHDAIFTSISLVAPDWAEQITLMGSAGASLTGNALDNNMHGNAGADAISGEAGNDWLAGLGGNDTLTGGTGADTFYFGAAPGSANADLVADFVSGTDRLLLDGSFHANAGPSGSFAVGDARFFAAAGASAGQDASDRVIYDTSSGRLWYDADGSGAGAAQLIATLEGAPALAATDIGLLGTSTGGQAINGTSGADSLTGGSGADTISGFGGDDTLNGSAGNDVLNGGAGRDTYVLDQLPGADHADAIQGFEIHWDEVRLDATVMPALGPSGQFSAWDVRFHAAAGAASGADESDRIVFDTASGNLYYDPDGSGSAAAQLIARLEPGPFAPGSVLATDLVVVNGSASGLLINGTEGNDSLSGTAGADTMNGLGGRDFIVGGEGNDTMDGGAGDDELHGDDGNDVVLGGAGNDTLSGGDGDDSLLGGDGDDTFWLGFFGGHDAIDGGAGMDAVDFNRFSQQSAVTVDLSAGTLAGGGVGGSGSASLASIEIVRTTQFDDHILGDAGANVLDARSGDDALDGAGGNDTLDGGDGNDTLSGGAGDDILHGRWGDDRLDGADGADQLHGHEGVDTLTGGGGADSFFIDTPPEDGADTVTDFASGSDLLRFDGAVFNRIGASGTFAAGDGRFHAAAGATGGHDADDRIVYDTATGNLYYDADGSGAGAAQLVVRLQGAPGLAATDIAVDSGSVVLEGGAGDDSLVGGPADDTLLGAGGRDTLDGMYGDDRLDGGTGNDLLIGREGVDVMLGGDGDDTLDGGSSADDWRQGGEPWLQWNGSDYEVLPGDTIDGGLGNDHFYVQQNDVITDPGGIDSVFTDADAYTLGAGFENLTHHFFGWSDGEGYFVRFSGNALDNVITIRTLWFNSSDELDGGAGNDSLYGSAGPTTFRFSLGNGDYGNDYLDGGSFRGDTIDFSDARSGFVADLGAGTLTGGGTGGSGSATLVSIDMVIGGAFDDRIVANPDGFGEFRDPELFGGGGNDTLEGAAGGSSYLMHGNDGNDRLVARAAQDHLVGGEGGDEFVFARAPGGDPVGWTLEPVIADFVSGSDRIVLDAAYMPALGPSGSFAAADARFHAAAGATGGHDADDRVIFNTSTQELFYDPDGSGGAAAQLIATLQPGATLVASDISVENGTPAGSVINGTAGNDSLAGTGSNDTIVGFAGNDTLNGAGGDDWLEGGPGQDQMTGGTGADSFVFRDTPFNNNYDRMHGFTSGVDEIVLDRDAYGNIGALGDFSSADGRFYAAAGVTSGHDADDRIIYNTSNGFLYYDADGSGAGKTMFIGILQGAPALAATDITVI